MILRTRSANNNGSLITTLDKKWCEARNIKQGDMIEIRIIGIMRGNKNG